MNILYNRWEMNYIVGRQYRTLVLGNILASAIKQAIAYIYIYQAIA